MDLKRLHKDIESIDGHSYNVGATVDKVKAVMLDMVSCFEELSPIMSPGYTTDPIESDQTEPGSIRFVGDLKDGGGPE